MNPTPSSIPVRSRTKTVLVGAGLLLTLSLTIAWVSHAADPAPGDPAAALVSLNDAQAFERWVEQHLRPLHELRPEHKGDSSLGTKNPSRLALTLQVGTRTYPFALECQWRNSVMGANSALGSGDGERSISQPSRPGEKTFMVLGIGGSADAPEELFIIPAHELPTDRVTMDYLDSFRQPMKRDGFHYDPFGGNLSF